MLETLRAEWQRIPSLLEQGAPPQPEPVEVPVDLEAELITEPDEPPIPARGEPVAPQLGLF